MLPYIRGLVLNPHAESEPTMPLPANLPPSRIPSSRAAPAMRWGVMGSGWIAEKFIESVRAHTR